jgi:hypothetical protein
VLVSGTSGSHWRGALRARTGGVSGVTWASGRECHQSVPGFLYEEHGTRLGTRSHRHAFQQSS